jgi:oxygen-independent coproporphyrinogen-3 oxidase
VKQAMPPDRPDAPSLGIYIHWPFCLAKCPYCDFNSHVSGAIDHVAWRDAYAAELRAAREALGRRSIATVFFGGGTPSLMPERLVGAILEEIARLWALAEDHEITLEANPTSVEASRFGGIRAAGVNRVSVGVQSLRDADLRRLGRTHSAGEAKEALALAQRMFTRVNLDLIYARQWQTPAEWEKELREALAFGTEHLSLYQLTIEEGTPFDALQRRGRLRGLPDEERAADMFELTQSLCADRGLPGYEISNHARPGSECRHNLRYWELRDVLGIGPGAHGRVTIDSRRMADESERDPARWIGQVKAHGSAVVRSIQPDQEVADEYILMGLRTAAGICSDRYAQLRGRPLAASTVSDLVDLGLLCARGTRIATTQAGRLLLNQITRTLAQ